MTICAATKWLTNADMIVDIVELGYIKPTDQVIDLTFGRGLWWTKYHHPGYFVANVDPDDDTGQVYERTGGLEAFGISRDYRDLGDLSNLGGTGGLFDVVVFDPPYVSMGGRETSTLPDFMDRFGLKHAATTPEGLQADNNLGLRETWRICKPGGIVLAKCAPYISSAVRKDGDWWTRDAALELGFQIEDMLIHVGDVRAQPKDGPCRRCEGTGNQLLSMYQECEKCHGTGRIPRKVKHARNNYSVLFVLRKPRARRRAKVSG